MEAVRGVQLVRWSMSAGIVGFPAKQALRRPIYVLQRSVAFACHSRSSPCLIMSSFRYLLTITAAILVPCAIAAVPPQLCSKTGGNVQVPPFVSLASPTAQFVSCNTGHDGPKVSPISATAYDWWYFDAVSDDGSEALTVVFFTASALGFPFELTSAVDATTAAVFATFADGTTSVVPLVAAGATITTAGDGASGVWKGAGNFTGAPDLSSYHVAIDSPLLGVHGTLQLTSVTRLNFRCRR